MSVRTFCIVFFSVATVLFAGGALYQNFFLASDFHNDRGARLLYPDSIELPPNSVDIVPLRSVGEPPQQNRSLLTGEYRSVLSDEIILGVMIDEGLPARKHFRGIEKADVIFEIPAEGGIPRLLAFFSSDSFPEQIGPVRSARPYFVEIAETIASAYVHAGGSPDALEMLLSSRMANIDEIENDPRFLREKDIARPHNLFLLPEKVLPEIPDDISNMPIFAFGEPSNLNSIPAENISLRHSNANHSVSYTYSLSQDCYTRLQDFETADICPNTLLVLKTDIWILENDEKNRLSVRTTGQGELTLFFDGKMMKGKWQRKEKSGFSFTDADGNELRIPTGKTFVHILGASESFSFSSPEDPDEDSRL
jgi:hypothetical protein